MSIDIVVGIVVLVIGMVLESARLSRLKKAKELNDITRNEKL